MARTLCPRCHSDIEDLRWLGSYSESGSASGYSNFEGEFDVEENECNDSDYDTDCYECNQCNAEIEADERENLAAIESDRPLPHPNLEGFGYYNFNARQREIQLAMVNSPTIPEIIPVPMMNESENIKDANTIVEVGTIRATDRTNRTKNLAVYQCECGVDTSTEKIGKCSTGDFYEDRICEGCGKLLLQTKENLTKY